MTPRGAAPLSLGDIRGLALGVLGMTRDEFYSMPVGEFWEALECHRRELEAVRRHLGELARGAALRLFNINLKKSDQIRDPVRFWRMPWDDDAAAEAEETAAGPMTDEQRFASARNLIDKIAW